MSANSQAIKEKILGFENKFAVNIIDPLHGQIGLTDIEAQVIETKAFRRLKNIQQLGFASNIYPGATHKRYEHCIGTLHVTWTMLKQFLVNYSNQLNWKNEKIFEYFSEDILKCTRLSALLHDVGHGPFSHTFEQVGGRLGQKIDHDKLTSFLLTDSFPLEFKKQLVPDENKIKEIESTPKILSFIKELRIIPEIHRKIIVNILEKNISFSPKPSGFDCIHLFLHDILKGDVGSDRIDYLLRDTYFSGLGHRFNFIDLLRNLKGMYDEKADRLLLAIDYEGRSIVEFIMMTRYYHYRLIAHHPSNVLDETRFEERVIKFIADNKSFSFFSTAADTDGLERDLPIFPEDIRLAGIRNLGSIGIDHFRFFFYRVVSDRSLSNRYADRVKTAIVNNVKIFEAHNIDAESLYIKFSVENPHLPIMQAYREQYTIPKDGVTDKHSVLLHDYSNLMQGLAKTYVEDSALLIFTSTKDSEKVAKYIRSTQHFLTNGKLFEDLMATVDDFTGNRFDFLIVALYKITNGGTTTFSGITNLFDAIKEMHKKYDLKHYVFEEKNIFDPDQDSFCYPLVKDKEQSLMDDLLVFDSCGLIELKLHLVKTTKGTTQYYSYSYFITLVERSPEETGLSSPVVPLRSALRLYSKKFLEKYDLGGLKK